MNRKKIFEASYAVALASPGVGGRSRHNYRIGAVIADGPVILSARSNSYKSDPKLLRYYDFPFYHAEAACIFNLGLLNCKDKTLYVTRVKRDNSIALAKPCTECQELISLARFKKIWYSTEHGYEILTL